MALAMCCAIERDQIFFEINGSHEGKLFSRISFSCSDCDFEKGSYYLLYLSLLDVRGEMGNSIFIKGKKILGVDRNEYFN